LGGFKVSFITDNIQGVMVLGLIIMGVIAVGVETEIDRSLIDQSGYLKPNLLGWQLIYILPVAILTNDFFLSGFWMRTFASRTDKDLWIGVSLASLGVLIILTLVGVAGLLAAWSGAYQIGDEETGSLALFLLLEKLPAWVVGVVLVMVVSLSTAAFDSFQSSMVSTGSNDLFRNKLNIWIIRGCVVLIIFPVVVVALRSPNILQIFLISDLVSAAVVPCLVIGLSEKFYWYRGFDFVVGGLGGILTIFLFGLVYYDGDATQASKLLLLENGLYADDWSAFGNSPHSRCSYNSFANHKLQAPSLQRPLEACSGLLELVRFVSHFSGSWLKSRAIASMLWIVLLLDMLSARGRLTSRRMMRCWSIAALRRIRGSSSEGRDKMRQDGMWD
jgi:Na+/proline symporter